jgi:formylglycine-generating enzyme required for sulfatase activity
VTRWLGTFEATAGCYHRCVWEGACTEPRWAPEGPVDPHAYLGLERDYWIRPSNADLPIVDLTRAGAAEYCAWLGGRLPTDVEWEKAARGESGRAWPWQADPPHPTRPGDPIEARTELCQHMHAFPDSGQAPNCPGTAAFVVRVTAFPEGVGPYGHLNLMGNAVEWVVDSAVPYAVSGEEARVDPPAAIVAGEAGVVRGLSSRASFFRQPEAPTLDWPGPFFPVGVRCAFDVRPEPLLPASGP